LDFGIYTQLARYIKRLGHRNLTKDLLYTYPYQILLQNQPNTTNITNPWSGGRSPSEGNWRWMERRRMHTKSVIRWLCHIRAFIVRITVCTCVILRVERG